MSRVQTEESDSEEAHDCQFEVCLENEAKISVPNQDGGLELMKCCCCDLTTGCDELD